MASSASAIPLSEIIRSKDDAVVEDGRGKSRDEWKKARELEEMRKVRIKLQEKNCQAAIPCFLSKGINTKCVS